MDRATSFRSRHEGGAALGAHRHEHAYAALVLRGGYDEIGPDGVWRCGPGDLVMHPPFHLHGDCFAPDGAEVLNFVLPFAAAAALGAHGYRIVRPRRPERLESGRDPLDALHEALGDTESDGDDRRPAAPPQDWRDRVAAALLADPSASIGRVAREAGVSPAHVSRAFPGRFGVRPAAFRAEQRLRAALRALAETGRDLADIAQEAGFADQAHMSRAVRAATGRTPRRLRAELAGDQFGSRKAGAG